MFSPISVYNAPDVNHSKVKSIFNNPVAINWCGEKYILKYCWKNFLGNSTWEHMINDVTISNKNIQINWNICKNKTNAQNCRKWIYVQPVYVLDDGSKRNSCNANICWNPRNHWERQSKPFWLRSVFLLFTDQQIGRIMPSSDRWMTL